jgi:hypothetical protein
MVELGWLYPAKAGGRKYHSPRGSTGLFEAGGKEQNPEMGDAID